MRINLRPDFRGPDILAMSAHHTSRILNMGHK